MRSALLVRTLAPTLAFAVAAAPAAAQVRVGVHIDIPILTGRPVIVHRPPPPPPPRYVVVYDYSQRDFGRWDRDARRWMPVTLWFWEGRYYEAPIGHARPVHLFQYHDRYFFEPRERGWSDYRDHVLRPRYDDRYDGRDYGNDRDGRNDRDYGNDRNDRDQRDNRDYRNDRNERPAPPAPVNPRARPRGE